MKKLFLIMLLFISFSIGAQELEWNRDIELEEFFYSWDLDVEVWRALDTINIEDVLSENWFDVRSIISTVLYSINDEAEYQGMTASELDFDVLVYSWFEKNDPTNELAKYESEDNRWDFYIDIEWLDAYFNTKRDKDKTLMVSNLVDASIIKWEDLNLDILKRDVEKLDIDNVIIEQQMQSDSIELRPKPKN